VVVTVAGVAVEVASVEAEVVEVSEVDMAVAVMVDIHVGYSENGLTTTAATTAIKKVISPANVLNNPKVVAVSVAEIVTEVIEAAVEAMAEAEEVAIVVAEAAVILEVKVMTRDVIKKISWL